MQFSTQNRSCRRALVHYCARTLAPTCAVPAVLLCVPCLYHDTPLPCFRQTLLRGHVVTGALWHSGAQQREENTRDSQQGRAQTQRGAAATRGSRCGWGRDAQARVAREGLELEHLLDGVAHRLERAIQLALLVVLGLRARDGSHLGTRTHTHRNSDTRSNSSVSECTRANGDYQSSRTTKRRRGNNAARNTHTCRHTQRACRETHHARGAAHEDLVVRAGGWQDIRNHLRAGVAREARPARRRLRQSVIHLEVGVNRGQGCAHTHARTHAHQRTTGQVDPLGR